MGVGRPPCVVMITTGRFDRLGRAADAAGRFHCHDLIAQGGRLFKIFILNGLGQEELEFLARISRQLAFNILNQVYEHAGLRGKFNITRMVCIARDGLFDLFKRSTQKSYGRSHMTLLECSTGTCPPLHHQHMRAMILQRLAIMWTTG